MILAKICTMDGTTLYSTDEGLFVTQSEEEMMYGGLVKWFELLSHVPVETLKAYCSGLGDD